MFDPATFEQFMGAVVAFKDTYKKHLTNLFITADELPRKVFFKKCFLMVREGCLLLAVQSDAYFQIYYYARDLNALGEALNIGTGSCSLPFICDIIGREPETEKTASFLEENGFTVRQKLVRLIFKPEISPDKKFAHPGEYAAKGDAREIQEILLKNFDVYGSQLPEIGKIQENIAKNQVAVIRKSGEIAAVEYFEINGKSLRKWFSVVAENYRSKFVYFEMKQFLFAIYKEKNIRKVISWRDESNQRLIEACKKEGEKPDGLVDYVMFRSKERPAHE